MRRIGIRGLRSRSTSDPLCSGVVSTCTLTRTDKTGRVAPAMGYRMHLTLRCQVSGGVTSLMADSFSSPLSRALTFCLRIECLHSRPQPTAARAAAGELVLANRRHNHGSACGPPALLRQQAGACPRKPHLYGPPTAGLQHTVQKRASRSEHNAAKTAPGASTDASLGAPRGTHRSRQSCAPAGSAARASAGRICPSRSTCR